MFSAVSENNFVRRQRMEMEKRLVFDFVTRGWKEKVVIQIFQ